MKPEPKEMSAERLPLVLALIQAHISKSCADEVEAHISHLESECRMAKAQADKLDGQAEIATRGLEAIAEQKRSAEQERDRLREALAYMIFWNETKHNHDLTGKRECPVCKAETALAAPAPSPECLTPKEAARQITDIIFGPESDKQEGSNGK